MQSPEISRRQRLRLETHPGHHPGGVLREARGPLEGVMSPAPLFFNLTYINFPRIRLRPFVIVAVTPSPSHHHLLLLPLPELFGVSDDPFSLGRTCRSTNCSIQAHLYIFRIAAGTG